MDVLYSDANKEEAYNPERVVRRQQIAHSVMSSAMLLAMRDVSELAGQLEDASTEELQVSFSWWDCVVLIPGLLTWSQADMKISDPAMDNRRKQLLNTLVLMLKVT